MNPEEVTQSRGDTVMHIDLSSNSSQFFPNDTINVKTMNGKRPQPLVSI